MAVNRIEPNMLTLHDGKGNTLTIDMQRNVLEFVISNYGDLPEHAQGIEVQKNQIQTIIESLSYWVESGRLDFQDRPVKIIKGENQPLPTPVLDNYSPSGVDYYPFNCPCGDYGRPGHAIGAWCEEGKRLDNIEKRDLETAEEHDKLDAASLRDQTALEPPCLVCNSLLHSSKKHER